MNSMTYICPFCKKRMIHHFGNVKTTEKSRIVREGDTFSCDCHISFGYNTWKFENHKWLFLTKNFTKRSLNPQYDNEWVLKEGRNSIPYREFKFNPSYRRKA